LHLPSRKGKSGKIGNWVRRGLRYIKLSDKRFFRDEDLVSFFEANMAKGREIKEDAE